MTRPIVVSLFVLVIAIALHSQTSFTLSQGYCSGSSQPCVLTYHNDNSRDGVNPYETTLTTTKLSGSSAPQGVFIVNTDGQIYAQPLYITGIAMTGHSATNVIYVMTENNTVYAIDAESSTGNVLASNNLNSAADLTNSTEIAVPVGDLPQNSKGQACANITPEVGITGTPVIDVSIQPPVIWLITKHEDVQVNPTTGALTKSFRQKAHGLYANSLQEIPHSPFVIDNTISSDFDPLYNNQRAGLTVIDSGSTANIFTAWASHCDNTNANFYDGYVIEGDYDYSTPNFVGTADIFNTESGAGAAGMSGIWMGGAAPAADSSSNIYVATGNGTDANQGSLGTREFSNSVLRLQDTGLQDFYSPPDYDWLNNGNKPLTTVACANPGSSCPSFCTSSGPPNNTCTVFLPSMDWDLGSGGVVLLNPTFSMTNPEMVAGGKQGMVYVLFSGGMGGIDKDPTASGGESNTVACSTATTPPSSATHGQNGAIVQCFEGPILPNPLTATDVALRGDPAFLGGTTSNPVNYLYMAGIADTLRAYNLQSCGSPPCGYATFNTSAVIPTSAHHFGYPGASPSITWNSSDPTNISTNAVVWALDTNGYAPQAGHASSYPADVYAYAAVPSGGSLGTALWSTSNHTNFTNNPGAIKFAVPTIVGGKVIVAGGAQSYNPGSGACQAPAVTAILSGGSYVGQYNGNPTACGAVSLYK